MNLFWHITKSSIFLVEIINVSSLVRSMILSLVNNKQTNDREQNGKISRTP